MMAKLIQKIRLYEKREKELLSVLFLLRKDGVKIEKAYKEVCLIKEERKKKQKNDEEVEDENFINSDSSYSLPIENDLKNLEHQNKFYSPKEKNKIQVK